MAPSDSFFLNIDKPVGETSRAVVDAVVKATGQRRCGHAGTLDPLASGTVVVAVGKATRLIEYVQQTRKTYEATFLLGQTSDTDDTEGNVVVRDVPSPPSLEEVQSVLQPFIGTIQQTPPAYSAVKVGGRRSYKLARQGREVALAPRPVEVHRIHLIEYAFPALRLTIECGAGTYVRSLARDLGEALGAGGLMSALRRTAVGRFTVAEAISLDDLVNGNWLDARIGLADAMSGLPRMQLEAAEVAAFVHGKPFRAPNALSPHGQRGETTTDWAAFDPQGRFLGITRSTPAGAVRALKGGFLDG